jgi:hypothetical protein
LPRTARKLSRSVAIVTITSDTTAPAITALHISNRPIGYHSTAPPEPLAAGRASSAR